MKIKTQLHCGACMTNFSDMNKLNKHIETCPFAIMLLPLIYKVWGGYDKMGHPLSHFVHLLHKNVSLIKKYAYAVADDIQVLERAKLHIELCEKLYLEYEKFRPFESDTITKKLTRKEALWFLLDSLVEIAKTKMEE